MTYTNGDKYIGDIIDDNKFWNGKYFIDGKLHYENVNGKKKAVSVFRRLMTSETKLSKSSYFSILGLCIENEKEFIYKCENENEVVELENLTWNLVISNGWKVYHDGLKIIASPPKKGE